MPLAAGDIAIVGFASDDPDRFAFVALAAIPAGEQIFFTDNGWLSTNAFRTGEGTLTWTAPAGGVAAGSVVTWTSGVGFSLGAGGTTGPAFSTAGDQIIAYQGTAASPTLIYALNDEGAGVWQATATDSNTSALPLGLINGTTAVALPEFDNYAYTGPTSGTKTELLAAIGNAANWSATDVLPAPAFPTAFSVGGGPAVTVSIAATAADAFEGDTVGGVFTFTVTRSDAAGAAQVDWALSNVGGAGQADASDFTGPTSGVVSFDDGESTKTVTLTAAPDAVVEPDETFSVTLSNAVGAVVGASTANGTIRNDDISLTAIYTIQGASHTSSFVGQSVITRGVVTALASNGFYLQDATGDGDIATSDGIFVFTSSAPTVSVGQDVRVTGTVSEFKPGSSGLSITQLTAPTITQLGTAALPAGTLLGAGGRVAPTAVIEDDSFSSYDPLTDGIDFWESIEGMFVTIENSRSVSPTARFGTSEEIWVVTINDGASDNDRGGVTIAPGDFNPHRIQIDDLINSLSMPSVNVGANFQTINGVVGYSFNNYEVLVSAAPVVVSDVLQREVTALAADAKTLTFGSMNVENLDANDPQAKFDGLAAQIVTNLKAPTIIAVQEMQDNNGAVNDGVTDASLSAQRLIDAIVSAGGPLYTYVDIAPANNTSGGEPGGNIRPGYLYRADVVSLVAGSLATLDVPAFNGSRDPLIAKFLFNGEEITFINNHFSSKGGDNPLFGATQPPVLNSEPARVAQAQVVNDYVDGLLAADPNAPVVVLGDLNDFSWSNPLRTLDGSLGGGTKILFDLADETIADPAERYSYNFEGNSQELDHMYVSQGALDLLGGFDIVHVNAEFWDQASDHDPSVASLVVNRAPVAVSDTATTDEDTAVTIDVLANDADADGDLLVIVDAGSGAPAAAHGTVAVVAGKLVYTPDADFNGADVITYAVTDGGFTVTSSVAVTVTPVNDAPAAGDDGGFSTAFNTALTIAPAALLANDEDGDPEVDQTLTIQSVQGGVNGTAALVAGNVVFTPTAGYSGAASFSYTVSDGAGGTDTATVSLTVRTAPPVGSTTVLGTRGGDALAGGDGRDSIYARAGDDTLDGGLGDDWLNGAQDDDLLTGGAGADEFRFDAREIAGGSDTDTIFDLAFGEGDKVVFASFGAGTLQGVAGGNPLQVLGGGAGAILDAWADFAELAAASAVVTATQLGATDTLVVSVTDTDGDVMNVRINNGLSNYLAAGGLLGI
jgi:predicted extracellular nuclease